MKKIQYTLYSKTNEYKPVSTVIEVETIKEVNENPDFYKQKAIQKICNQRRWSAADLKRLGYTQLKTRIYEEKVIVRKKKEGAADVSN